MFTDRIQMIVALWVAVLRANVPLGTKSWLVSKAVAALAWISKGHGFDAHRSPEVVESLGNYFDLDL